MLFKYIRKSQVYIYKNINLKDKHLDYTINLISNLEKKITNGNKTGNIF